MRNGGKGLCYNLVRIKGGRRLDVKRIDGT